MQTIVGTTGKSDWEHLFGQYTVSLLGKFYITFYELYANEISSRQTVKAFLPDMMEINRGHIVTVGSVAGLLGTYGCTDYSGTKFACVGFHESLYTELKTHGYDKINLTLVCPYYINTGMFSGVKPRLMPMLEPDYVADQITSSVQKNEVNCTLPGSVRMLLPLKWWVWCCVDVLSLTMDDEWHDRSMKCFFFKFSVYYLQKCAGN